MPRNFPRTSPGSAASRRSCRVERPTLQTGRSASSAFPPRRRRSRPMSAPSPEPDTTAPRVHSLANGVRVVCDPIPGLQTVALTVVAGCGARSEDEARSGWSHLLEHMVFKGAGGRSARGLVEAIEAEGGHINAATGYERTSFQVRALKHGLDLGSAVISDLILRPHMEASDLAREKQVVAQEIAEAADAPDDLV